MRFERTQIAEGTVLFAAIDDGCGIVGLVTVSYDEESHEKVVSFRSKSDDDTSVRMIASFAGDDGRNFVEVQ